MKNFFGLLFLFIGIAQGAYNPFFDDAETSKKSYKPSTLPLLPPPLFTHPSGSSLDKLPSLPSTKMLYFGFIETDKGKFAMMKVHDNNIVLKENNRVYIDNELYYVRDISSNAVVMEDKDKKIKTIYFSGEMEGKK